MMKTVVGVFTSNDDARQVRDELVSAGFPQDRVHITSDGGQASGTGSAGMGTTGTTDTTMGASTASTGIMSTDGDDTRTGSTHEGGISGFFSRLFGSDDSNDAQPYRSAMTAGHCVVTVDAMDESQVEQASDIMAQYDPVELEERPEGQGMTGSASMAGTGGTTGMGDTTGASDITGTNDTTGAHGLTGSLDDGARATPNDWAASDVSRDTTDDVSTNAATRSKADTTGTNRIPVVEEELQIGKRLVQRGGVRVFTRVTETPVEASVNLREEHARVERHPVNRPATEADFDAFKEGSIELRETAEQPVVQKVARVVEEVELGQEATQHTETVRDTVRRSSVEVERIPGSETQLDTDTARTTRPTSDR